MDKPNYNSTSNPRIAIDILPECAFFSITEQHFKDDSWRRIVDVLAEHGMYNLLTVTMRIKNHPINEPSTKALFKRLVAYADDRGLGVAIDLDPRLARGEFRRRYPDECQRMVYLRELTPDCAVTGFEIDQVENFTDHMTGNGTSYFSFSGKLLRIWTLKKDHVGSFIPDSIKDITASARVNAADGQRVAGSIPAVSVHGCDAVIVAAEFTLFTPDVFSPHIIPYQRELLEMYDDLPLKGVVKDEWGFPPTRQMMIDGKAFWFSPGYAADYARDTRGRDLLDDLPLMAWSWVGCESNRLCAINHYMDLNLKRNAEIEEQYYNDVKSVFGPDAFVAKHATWYPRLNEKEVYKNGLSWWAAKRDWAQTDEITPLSACTALSKKFNSPNWLNEGYADNPEIYRRNIWRYAAAGGRMVFHPIFGLAKNGKLPPGDAKILSHGLLLTRDLIRAQCRVRLLNFISTAPLNCPVAWVFGHPGMMNRAAPAYLDYGEELTLDLWRRGHAVDVYPSSEILADTFKVMDNGAVAVGRQKYKVLVLYRPDLCQREIADFFTRASASATKLFVIGDWTRDFEGAAFDGISTLGGRFKRLSPDEVLDALSVTLDAEGAVTQPPLVEPFRLFQNNMQIGLPAPQGQAHLLDGTVVLISATQQSDAGDPINATLKLSGMLVSAQAEGVFAVRLNPDGKIEAMAAGGLSAVHGPGLDLKLDTPLDLALWRDADGKWNGVIQGEDEIKLSPALAKLDADWKFLGVPPEFTGNQVYD